MKVHIFYGKSLGTMGVDAIFSFISVFGGLQPKLNQSKRLLEYSGVDAEDAETMRDYLKGIENIDISCEMEPQDYKPFILADKNDDIGVTMAFKREENGDKALSMQITNSREPIEVIGELTIALDYDKLEDLKRWVHEVTG